MASPFLQSLRRDMRLRGYSIRHSFATPRLPAVYRYAKPIGLSIGLQKSPSLD